VACKAVEIGADHGSMPGAALAIYYPLSGEVAFDWPRIVMASQNERDPDRGMALILLAARRVGERAN
jgi:hypothetical protein